MNRLATSVATASHALGPVGAAFRRQTLDRRCLLLDLTACLRTALGADAVILNETALRTVPLGDALTLGRLLSIEPLANQLVHAHVPEPDRRDLRGLLSRLTAQAGPLSLPQIPCRMP